MRYSSANGGWGMKWWRDLLFLALVGGGVLALAVNLVPRREQAPLATYDNPAYRADDFRATVNAVNTSFQTDWAKNQLTPAPVAPDLLLARRLSLALLGTVPSLQEVRQLEALPPGEMLPWWLDKMLDDRRFADFWAERFARMTVGTEDGPFVLFRRRRYVSWLSDELHKNTPYDGLVREIIAGQGLWTDHPATNFITVTSQQGEGKENQPDPVRLAGRVTRAFLGLRIDCAQCHDHPFASWKQSQFEGFSAFFGQTHVGFSGVHDAAGEYSIFDRKLQKDRTVPPTVPFSPELLPSSGARRTQLAAWVTHPQNPYFARAIVNRVWALMLGRALVDPVDNIETDGPPPEALTILANDFTTHGYDLRRLIRLIAASEVFALDSAAPHEITENHEKTWAVFPLSRLRPEQVSGSVLQAASIATNDGDAHIILRLMRYGQQNQFLERYSDKVEDEFDNRGGTIPQRLLMMNGELVRERLKETPINATVRVAQLSPNPAKAIESAFLATLTRRPTAAELAHFESHWQNPDLNRNQRSEDLFWSLLNCTEFSWNH
jgi:hypothetical protein